MSTLKGKKTYLVAAAMVIVAGLHALGYIDEATFRALQGILLGGGLAALRAGVNNALGAAPGPNPTGAGAQR